MLCANNISNHDSGRGHGRSLYVAAPTTFLRRDECDRPDKHRSSDSGPRSGQGDGLPTIFLRVGDARRAVSSLLLLLAGDVETNPGQSCYVCGQNVRQSDTPLICHTPDCKIRTHRQTHAVVCPDLNRGIAQPTMGPDHQLPLIRYTIATAVTTRSGQAPDLSPVLLRAA